MRPVRGLSLLETVVAMMLLLGVLLMEIASIQKAARYNARSQREQRACLVLQNAVARLRAQALQPGAGGYGYDDLLALSGTHHTDADYPNFAIYYFVQEHTGSSPNSSLDSRYSGTSQRRLKGWMLVEISVRWGSQNDERLTAVTLLRDPPRQLAANPVEISPVTAPPGLLPRDGQVSFKAILRDNNGRPLEGAKFCWSVQTLTGNGTIRTASNGEEATFTNGLRLSSGDYGFTGGQVQIRATARYLGREVSALSLPLDLQP